MSRRERRLHGHDERRSHRRVDAATVPSLSAQLSGGARVDLLDLSTSGVRLETTRHMRPGQLVSVRFSIDQRIVTINASVVRASVTKVDAEEVRYETGLRLCDEFACDELQLAMIERRHDDVGPPEPDAPVVTLEPEAPAVPLEFTHIDETHPATVDAPGWWLSRRRRRSPRHGGESAR